MHISNCYHPKLINNPYTGERIAVSCGHCPACRDKRAAIWVQRLNEERKLHQYGIFFTLTYAPEYVPTCKLVDGYFVSEPQKFIFRDSRGYRHTIRRDGLFEPAVMYYRKQDRELLKELDYTIKYAPTCDEQNFVKRLRRRIDNGKFENKSIRYFAVSEYGETTFRPHWHFVLFFDGRDLAKEIEKLIFECWPFSNRDLYLKFFETGCSSYVASYVNCLSMLPRHLKESALRPKAYMSRCPFIGNGRFSDEEIKQIFYSSTPTFTVENVRKQSVESVPLWRSFKDKYFPRCLGYGQLSAAGRRFMYGVSELFADYECFERYCRNFVELVPSKDSDYELYSIFSRIYDAEVFGLFKQIWRTSVRVGKLCDYFGCNLDTYVTHLDEFYKRVEYENLKAFYEWSEEYFNEHPERLWEYEHCFPVHMEEVKQSYCYDVPFLGEVTDTFDYKCLVSMHDTIEHNNKQTKVKNDYLDAHPELKSLYYLNKLSF